MPIFPRSTAENYEVKTYGGEKPEVDSDGKSVADLIAENADTAVEIPVESDEALTEQADQLLENAEQVYVLNADNEVVAELSSKSSGIGNESAFAAEGAEERRKVGRNLHTRNYAGRRKGTRSRACFRR